MMKFVFSTGGREKYFRAENVGDCVCRAICNATGLDYMTVYNMIQELSRDEKRSKKSSARNGVCKDTVDKLLKKLGWNKVVTCKFGQGVQMHLTEEELPKGHLIVRVSKHLTNVRDGVIYDTYNCSVQEYFDDFGNRITNDKRAVYAYWVKA